MKCTKMYTFKHIHIYYICMCVYVTTTWLNNYKYNVQLVACFVVFIANRLHTTK